ncbi:MAG: complex I NDUFA9 subunit family protein [Rhodocyclaceae bacterium]|nr:complex I NDUFA9 subunit family protein [Rhodocyclaceae bacterium]
MAYRNILILGGTGFLGAALTNQLHSRGCRVTLPTRRRRSAMALAVCPTAELVEADIFSPDTLVRLLEGQDAAINLVGVLHGGNAQPYGAGFARAHVELPAKLADACIQAGVRRLLHVSALHADAKGPSQYLRSKGDGEAALKARADRLDISVFRPSVIFGPGDSFLNLFADLLKTAPFVPLAGAHARFQPVYVGDVARVMMESLSRSQSMGQSYDLGGPAVYELQELVRLAGKATGRFRPVFPLPDGLARIMAAFMEFLPNPPMTRDNLDSMKLDSVCAGSPLPFGMAPTPLEAVLPAWLHGTAPYDTFRTRARR